MNDTLKLFTKKIKKLPTLPVIAQELLNMAADDSVSVAKLENIIENDPSIAAKILSVSNSAFFGVEPPNTSINNAIVRIGFNNVKNIALGIALLTVIGGRNNGNPLNSRKLFMHCVSVGLVARLLADRLNVFDRDEVFLCGLLHDLGLFVMNSYMEDFYYPVVLALKDKQTLPEAEKKVLGFRHTDMGLWLAETWKLPDFVRTAIYFHHDPRLSEDRLAALIYLADYISIKNFYSPAEKLCQAGLDYAALDLLELAGKDIVDLEAGWDKDLFSGGIFSYG